MFRKENTFDVEGRSGRRQPFVVPSPLLFRASSGRHGRNWAAPGRQHPGGRAYPLLITDERKQSRAK